MIRRGSTASVFRARRRSRRVTNRVAASRSADAPLDAIPHKLHDEVHLALTKKRLDRTHNPELTADL
jgi:hypothetical protein